ncbi:hypothetical protein [Acaryochloris sp. CCMEE 5410]|uniref:hypothetical protein n=1 Tax=Acaryochloris sp. CCMEE 5410 TaxID=310037 RepID=UPI0015854B2E|nr:hypothetical protein [Acaryochloris sp. CCMEE 5410]KAI9131974.1 hypothetical protein ON05_000105 [Acaryochloris sp. CCMEE 5410]
MANNQQQRFSGNHMLPGVATPVGSGVWSAPKEKVRSHIDIGPQPLARTRTKRSGASY